MKAFFLRLWAFFTKTEKTLYTQLEPVFASEIGKLWEKLIPLALPIVTALFSAPLEGTEKLKSASATLAEAAKTAGIEAAKDVLNSSVELALQIAKQSLSDTEQK